MQLITHSRMAKSGRRGQGERCIVTYLDSSFAKSGSLIGPPSPCLLSVDSPKVTALISLYRIPNT